MDEKVLETARECGACFPYPLGEKYGPQVVFTPTDFERFTIRIEQRALLNVPIKAIATMLNQCMEQAVANGANSVSMPDEYVEIAVWLAELRERSKQ